MNEIKTLDELKALGKEKGLLLLFEKEQDRTLAKFINRIYPGYLTGNYEVMVFRLLKDLGWLK